MSQTSPSVSSQPQQPKVSGLSLKKLFILFVIACLIGGLVYLIIFLYKKVHPPPPPPPGEVFGIELKDFNELYDQNFQIQPDGTMKVSGTVLNGDRISSILPSGFNIATFNQLQVAAFQGMQQCAWGICLSSQNTDIVGAYPIQGGVDGSSNTLCGIYDASLLTAPRVVTVTPMPSDVSYPTVLWIHGIKPKQGTEFRFATEDLSKPGRTIYPWFTPLPNQPGSVQWSYDPSNPSVCSKVNKSCIYAWATTVNDTTRMFLSILVPSNTQTPGLTYLTLSPTPSMGWQLLSNGYLVSPTGVGNMRAVSYPTAYEGYPLGVLTFPSEAAITLQPPQQGSSGVNPTGASAFTLTSSGNITLTAFPTFGLAYGTVSTGSGSVPGSYIIMTADKTKWLTFTPISWSDAINAFN